MRAETTARFVRSKVARAAQGAGETDVVACVNCGRKIVAGDAVEVGLGVDRQPCSYTTCGGGGFAIRETAPLCADCAESIFGFDAESSGYTDVVPGFVRWAWDHPEDAMRRSLGVLVVLLVVGIAIAMLTAVAIP